MANPSGLRIVIEGGPKEGKSTLAVMIADMLAEHGLTCEMRDDSKPKDRQTLFERQSAFISRGVKIEIATKMISRTEWQKRLRQ